MTSSCQPVSRICRSLRLCPRNIVQNYSVYSVKDEWQQCLHKLHWDLFCPEAMSPLLTNTQRSMSCRCRRLQRQQVIFWTTLLLERQPLKQCSFPNHHRQLCMINYGELLSAMLDTSICCNQTFLPGGLSLLSWACTARGKTLAFRLFIEIYLYGLTILENCFIWAFIPCRLQEKELGKLLQRGLGSRILSLRVFSRTMRSSPVLDAPSLGSSCVLVAAKVWLLEEIFHAPEPFLHRSLDWHVWVHLHLYWTLLFVLYEDLTLGQAKHTQRCPEDSACGNMSIFQESQFESTYLAA